MIAHLQPRNMDLTQEELELLNLAGDGEESQASDPNSPESQQPKKR